MEGRINAKKKTKNIPCPAKDKMGLDIDDILSQEVGLVGSYKWWTGQDTKDVRRHQEGKSVEKNAQQLMEEFDQMKEGDVFLKHSDSPDSTNIALRENSITLSTANGATGLKIKGGSVDVQGELKIKNLGFQISKAWFTENPLSFLPSMFTTPLPGYLFKIPGLDLLSKGVMDLLKTFTKNFYKG